MLNSNKGYEWSCRSCRDIGGDIKDLKQLILKLQDDIKELKVGGSGTRTTLEDNTFEEIVAEVEDRARRRRNLVFFGIPEPPQDIAPTERVSRDREELTAVLHVIKPRFNIDTLNPTRVGRFSATKSRPVKIRLASDDQVADIIRNAKALKNSQYKNKVSISFDRTPKQLSFYRSVKAELTERRNSEERNLRIKYVNGVPKIIASEN